MFMNFHIVKRLKKWGFAYFWNILHYLFFPKRILWNAQYSARKYNTASALIQGSFHHVSIG
jgi:hypothetical protein